MNEIKPALLVLTPGFPINETDSTCLPAQQNFIKAVNKNYPGITVIIVSFQYPFNAGRYQWHENKVYAFGGKNKNGLYRRLLWSKIFRQLKKLHQQYTFGGILSFWCDECAMMGARFSEKSGIPHYCWLLGQDARENNKYVAMLSGPSNHFIALSDFVSRSFTANYNVKPVATIPPGIAPEDFSTRQQVRDIDLLAAGSLIPLKQFDLFIKVAAKLKRIFPSIRIVLCGDGPEMSRLKLMAIQCGIAANISFTGELPQPSLLLLMQRSKILLHPSSYEGFGMVCAEALYAGAQVISFCKPVDAPVKNWHIADNEFEMKEMAARLLHALPAPERVLYYSADETATAVIQLLEL